MAGNKDGQAITVRQYVVLRQIIKGKGTVLTGQVRSALAAAGVEMSLITNLATLKNMQRNGWIKGAVKDNKETNDGVVRATNAWVATKAGVEVYERTKKLLASPATEK